MRAPGATVVRRRSANTEILRNIRKLDFAPLIAYMKVRKQWSEKRTQEAIVQYQDFFFQLVVTDAGESLRPPSGDADELWHAHILHTKKYHQDCKKIAGRYIHHTPILPKPSPKKCTQEEESDCSGACCGG